MTTLTRIKLALALIGVVVFAAGVRFDDERLRYVGIGFVAAAWILRFVKRRAPVDSSSDPTSPPEP